MRGNMRVVENIGEYKVIHNIPELNENEKEEIRREILKNLFDLFTSTRGNEYPDEPDEDINHN